MIRIVKGIEPQALTLNKSRWTNDLLGYLSRGEKIPNNLKNNYNHVDVKDALRKESRFKCMYCESTIAHVSHEHIEHIKPKSIFPDLTSEWDNLGLACQVCNMNKGNEYDNTYPFINPYLDDPANFLVALGHIIHHRPNNTRGELTQTIIQLNRPELLEKRSERLDSIKRLIDRYHATTNPLLQKVLKDQIEIEIAEDKPYTMCAQSLYKAFM
ncbi:HNH endonuclease [Adhaeribacter arboris]|uniref:HNH endonuclease n=1 Tax=Adhaeribacter arboris TaxID=2072846 RepID=A0A2T2YJV3_9BACT|nr:HNH endonuclease [Adhaeribacter arboris]PSR55769.1 HNH endonuclease [Adhaeribacter arboris]